MTKAQIPNNDFVIESWTINSDTNPAKIIGVGFFVFDEQRIKHSVSLPIEKFKIKHNSYFGRKAIINVDKDVKVSLILTGSVGLQ